MDAEADGVLFASHKSNSNWNAVPMLCRSTAVRVFWPKPYKSLLLCGTCRLAGSLSASYNWFKSATMTESKTNARINLIRKNVRIARTARTACTRHVKAKKRREKKWYDLLYVAAVAGQRISFIRLVSHCDGQDMVCDYCVCEKRMHLFSHGHRMVQFALCAFKLVNPQNESKHADNGHESENPSRHRIYRTQQTHARTMGTSFICM